MGLGNSQKQSLRFAGFEKKTSQLNNKVSRDASFHLINVYYPS